MASSGTINASNRKDIKASIECVINSQNVNTNKSNVTVKVKVWRTNSGYTTYGPGTVYCTINGTQYSVKVGSNDKISYGTTYTWFTKTLDISHNSDGTKNLTIKASISHSQFSIPSTSWTTTLTTIPRASSFTMNKSTVTLGGNVAFTISRASSSFTHIIKVAVNGKYYTLAENVATSSTVTTSINWANNITNSASTNATVYVETYNGSTKLGYTSKTLKLDVPSTLVPVITRVDDSEVGTGYGKYLKGKSKSKVNVYANSVYGASISTYKVEVAGYINYGAETISGYLSVAGTHDIKVTVTDTRGRQATLTKKIEVLYYEPPTVTLKVTRCNKDGTPNSIGEYADVRYRTKIFMLNSDSKATNKLYLQESTVTDQWYVFDTNNYLNFDNDIVYVKDGISTNKAFKFKVECSDGITTSTANYSLGTAYSIFHFANQGKSLGICKACERDRGVELGEPLYVHDLITIVRNDGLKEPTLIFEGCGETGWTVQVYGGSNTSGTVFGVWDISNGAPVWRYTTGQRLNLEAEIGKKLRMTNGTSGLQYWHVNGSAFGDMVMCNTGGETIYVGSASHSDGILPDTRVRGKDVRLYAHKGGGVFLGSSGSTAITSDKNLKTNIAELDDRYLIFFSKLIPVSFIYNGKNRKHMGFIAQDVEQAMKECNIDSMEFAGLIKEQDVDIDVCVDGVDTTEHYDELYSLRYEEFIPINVKVTQYLLNRLSNIESDIDLIKQKLNL